MVEHQPSKLDTWVRFPSPAFFMQSRRLNDFPVKSGVCGFLAILQLFIHMQEGRDQESVCKYPGDGSAEAGGVEAEEGDQHSACEASCQHFEYARQYGESGESDSLYHKADDVYQSQRKIEQGAYYKEKSYIADNLGIFFLDKQACQGFAQKKGCQQGDHRITGSQEDTGFQPLGNAFQLSGADILAAIGGHGGTHGVKRTGQEIADLTCGGYCGHSAGTQGVHSRLQDDAADGGNGILQPHGNSHIAQSNHHVAVGTPLLPGNMEDIKFLYDINQAEEAGYALGNHGSPGGA